MQRLQNVESGNTVITSLVWQYRKEQSETVTKPAYAKVISYNKKNLE